ncbi:MAG: hypothetical protein JWM40_1644 [Frankiales bacterium]|nr:hypothetical protein [Frankiales bacterium]
MADDLEPEGPAVPGGVDANLGAFDEGLQNPPAYRGRTYRTALVLGCVVLLVLVLALIIANLS